MAVAKVSTSTGKSSVHEHANGVTKKSKSRYSAHPTGDVGVKELSNRVFESMREMLAKEDADNQIGKAELLPSGEEWMDKGHFQHKVDKYGKSAVHQAVKSSEKMLKLQDNLGLSKRELFEIALFIETKLMKRVKKGRLYFKKERTGLARTVEYDPKSERIFIHLKKHGVSPLGEGWHKKVTRSIMYDSKYPEIVANCLCYDKEARKEIKLHRKFKGMEGLAHTYAITEHRKRKTGKKVTSIICRLYNADSLRHHQFHREDLKPLERVIVARDLLYGLEHMHHHHLSHRDMHGGNFLVDRRYDPKTKQEVVSAAIIDFGQTMRLGEARKKAPAVQVPRRFNPPEAFKKHKHKYVDARAADVYALGCNLFHLYYHKVPSWSQKQSFSNIRHLDNHDKHYFKKKLTHKMKTSLGRRHHRLHEKERRHINSNYDLFAKVVLQMCNPDPKKRGTAHELRRKLDALIHKIKVEKHKQKMERKD